MANSFSRVLFTTLTVVAICVFASPTDAQNAAKKPAKRKRAYELNPRPDRIQLDRTNENKVLTVNPIQSLPTGPGGGRRVPDPKTMPSQSLLRVRLVEEDDKQYDVKWKHIVSIDLFENRVLREANAVVNQIRLVNKKETGKIDEAWEYFQFLLQEYPDTEHLDISIQRYLFKCGLVRLLQGRQYEALSIYEDLYNINPDFVGKVGNRPVNSSVAFSQAVGRVLQDYYGKGDFYSFRRLLKRLSDKYGAGKVAAIDKWRDTVNGEALKLRDQSRAKLAAGELRESHELSRLMLDRWPDVEGGKALIADVTKAYPLVVVGVFQPTNDKPDSMSLHNWGSRRSTRLLHQSLAQYVAPSPSGGQYNCPIGALALDSARTKVTVRLSSDSKVPMTGYDIARRLIDMANPGASQYVPAWAGLVKTIAVNNIYDVEIEMRHPFVLPQAMMQVPITLDDPQGKSYALGRYSIAKKDKREILFGINEKVVNIGASRPVEIVERYFTDPEAAMLALRRGEIDILDRISPADLIRLEDDGDFVIAPYALPIVHVLVPGRKTKFMDNLLFRRALAYGINAQQILNQAVMKRTTLPGYRQISGPFLAGILDQSSYAYAYDQELPPIPYDPALAKILMDLTLNQLTVAAEKIKKPAPSGLPPIVIGHPAEEHARVSCNIMKTQLEPLGLKVTVKEFPPGVTLDEKGECDLVYTELAMWEPIVDARRLLGADGLIPTKNDYVNLALRELDVARSWPKVRKQLKDLHRITYDEMVVIPLWQTMDHLIYHRRIRGIGKSPTLLYQNVSQWQIVPDIEDES